jgi:hypothetical protein
MAWTARDLRDIAADHFQGADPERLRQAIEGALPDHRGGRVYTFRLLVDALPAALQSFGRDGSEWLNTVAARLGDTAFRPRHRADTTGYLLACDVPWALIGNETVECIARDMIHTQLIHHLKEEQHYRIPVCTIDCVDIAQRIPPRNISLVVETDELDQTSSIDTLQWAQYWP